jgi:hypothetical protein
MSRHLDFRNNANTTVSRIRNELLDFSLAVEPSVWGPGHEPCCEVGEQQRLDPKPTKVGEVKV